MQCKFIWVLEMVANWTFCQITFFPILVIFTPIWPDIEQVTQTNHTSHKPDSFCKWPNNPRTDAMPNYMSIGEGCQLNFFQITFFPILVNFAPIWPDIEQVTLTNHTSHKPNSFANDQTTLGLMPCQVIWVYMRKANRVVHEKSVKMQLLQILLQIKPQSHIWTEIILAKYQRPHFKNEREQLRARRRYCCKKFLRPTYG